MNRASKGSIPTCRTACIPGVSPANPIQVQMAVFVVLLLMLWVVASPLHPSISSSSPPSPPLLATSPSSPTFPPRTSLLSPLFIPSPVVSQSCLRRTIRIRLGGFKPSPACRLFGLGLPAVLSFQLFETQVVDRWFAAAFSCPADLVSIKHPEVGWG